MFLYKPMILVVSPQTTAPFPFPSIPSSLQTLSGLTVVSKCTISIKSKKPGSISIKTMCLKPAVVKCTFLPPRGKAQNAWLNFFFRAISLNYLICCKTILPPSSQAQKAWLNFFFRAISLDYFIWQNCCLPRAKPKKNLAQFLLKTMSLKLAVGRAHFCLPRA